MKNLLKISCVLAIALFVSMSVKAEEPLGNTVTTGDITVNVPKYLLLSVDEPTVAFKYDEFTGTSELAKDVWVNIQSNIAFKFAVYADGPLTSGANTIALDKITYSFDFLTTPVLNEALTNGSVKSIVKPGSMSMQGAIHWALAPLGNKPAGNYTANLTYMVVEQE